jgi:eukaryotic-like serine/threonine-protein kinase
VNPAAILRRTDGEVAAGAEIVPGYVVVARLSQGGRFETYDVYSPERDCRCILKTVRADRGDQESGRAALLREGMLLRDLTHPHLVRAYEVLETPRAAVVTEILTGATLAALIEEHGPLSTADTVLLGLHLTSVLGYLHHHGWLHLDVKPSNVVVQAGRAVLIDLGIVARPGDGRPHAGTWGYMAPEQSTGRALTPATDVFGLGITFAEALTDSLPYGEEGRWRKPHAKAPGRSFRRRLSLVPESLADLVEACVKTDPAQRPALGDVRATLTAFRSDPAK